MLQKLEVQVMELYHRADQAVAEYKVLTELSCPAGCVHCCNSEKVEATVLEMIPLAYHLFKTNQAELLLKRLEKSESSCCILFRPDLVGTTGGGCSQYTHRALVCRLFGFAGNLDRTGVARLALCRVMKESMSSSFESSYNGNMPIFHDFGFAVTTMHPALGDHRLPINHALGEALLKVGLHLDLEGPPPSGTSSDSPRNEPFDRPFQPRRRAA
jgi:Fe-S-cluster containining protein